MTATEVTRESGRDIHAWFGLTYASYLVIPRTHLQSMPLEWQERFTDLLREWETVAHINEWPSAERYRVQAVDDRSGRFTKDPCPPYSRGRTHLPIRDSR